MPSKLIIVVIAKMMTVVYIHVRTCTSTTQFNDKIYSRPQTFTWEFSGLSSFPNQAQRGTNMVLALSPGLLRMLGDEANMVHTLVQRTK